MKILDQYLSGHKEPLYPHISNGCRVRSDSLKIHW